MQGQERLCRQVQSSLHSSRNNVKRCSEAGCGRFLEEPRTRRGQMTGVHRQKKSPQAVRSGGFVLFKGFGVFPNKYALYVQRHCLQGRLYIRKHCLHGSLFTRYTRVYRVIKLAIFAHVVVSTNSQLPRVIVSRNSLKRRQSGTKSPKGHTDFETKSSVLHLARRGGFFGVRPEFKGYAQLRGHRQG